MTNDLLTTDKVVRYYVCLRSRQQTKKSPVKESYFLAKDATFGVVCPYLSASYSSLLQIAVRYFPNCILTASKKFIHGVFSRVFLRES
jgi:hypothetical protein